MSSDSQVQREVYSELQRNASAGDSAIEATAVVERSHNIRLALQLARRRKHIGSGPARYVDFNLEEASQVI